MYITKDAIAEALGIPVEDRSAPLIAKLDKHNVHRVGLLVDPDGILTTVHVYYLSDANRMISELGSNAFVDPAQIYDGSRVVEYENPSANTQPAEATPDVKIIGEYDESTRRLILRLKGKEAGEFEQWLDQVELVEELSRTEMGRKPGWLASAMGLELSWGKSLTTQYQMIGTAFIRTLGREAMRSAGFRDRKKFYYAARMVLVQGEEPSYALDAIKNLSRASASEAANGNEDPDLVPLPFHVPRAVAGSFQRGINRLRTMTGESESSCIERLAAWLENAAESAVVEAVTFYSRL